jgi:hypothetical protein
MASSHLQVIFIPPAHFSIVIVHRGTIIHCGAAGMAPVPPMGPAVPVPIPGIPIPARSITIALVMIAHPRVCSSKIQKVESFLRSLIAAYYPNVAPDFNIKPQGYHELRIAILPASVRINGI